MVKKKDGPKLSRHDWIEQGLKALAASGIEAVRVEPLAKMMQVTKGSFYWHFRNRAELLTAILEKWVSQQTDGIIDQVEAAGGMPREKLLRLFELAIQDEGREEIAIRAWATNDAIVAKTLVQVDQRRLDYTKDLFISIGFTSTEALVRARMAYYALVGEFAIGVYPKAYANQAERLTEIRLRYEILVNTTE
ncbi:TetR/AcrR family transcriptional regulator [Acaryochloris thomasi]|nr:TetR/AcrR family transcriptional regulator [Acaryochloris thomasi]